METKFLHLTALIERDFSDTVHPGHNMIALERPILTDYEGNSVKEFFKEKCWQEVTLDTLDPDCLMDISACLSFLKPEGFRYYLPAFLRIALDFEHGGEVADALCHFLTPPRADSQQEDRNLFFARIAGMSEAQKAAVELVLEFLSDKYKQAGYPDDPAADALSGYWQRDGV